MDGTFTDVREWKQLGVSAGVNITESAANIAGYLRLKAADYYIFEKRFINIDGTITSEYSTDPSARIVKLPLDGFQGGTIEYYKAWLGTDTRAVLAFYSSDFVDKPDTGLCIRATASNVNENNKRVIENIPENSKVALLSFYEKSDIDQSILLKKTGSSFDEKITPLLSEQQEDYVSMGNNIVGKYDYRITSYETGKWIGHNGTIETNNLYTDRAVVTIPVLDNYRGGRVGYYKQHTGDFNDYDLAFYNNDDIFINGVHCSGSTDNFKYYETDIPENASYLAIYLALNQFNGEDKKVEDYPVTFFSKEGNLTLYSNSKKIQLGHEDYILPLGVMDNLLVDAIYYYCIGNMQFISSPYHKDANGMTYGITAKKSIYTNETKNTACTFVFKIRKSSNPNRVLNLRSSSGMTVDFNDNAQCGQLLHQNSVLMGYVIRQEKDYIWIYGNSDSCAHGKEETLISYTDKTKATFEKIEIDRDRSFSIPGIHKLEELDIDKRYYTRPEKLDSRLIGKTAIVFADSLSFFAASLVQDWGMNIISIAEGGNRMGYTGGGEDTWICEDEKIQTFRSYGLKKADCIIFVMGTNDPDISETTAEDLKFVLANKRWFDSDLETDPFASLGEDGKKKFGAAASLYAAAYSLCRIYKDAIVAIMPPFRSPGVDCTDYDADTFADVLFNGRFINKTKALRSIAEKIGAIFIDNPTRNNAASADNYHGTDGTHPSNYVVYQDEASNIGHALSKYYDSIENIINAVTS